MKSVVSSDLAPMGHERIELPYSRSYGTARQCCRNRKPSAFQELTPTSKDDAGCNVSAFPAPDHTRTLMQFLMPIFVSTVINYFHISIPLLFSMVGVSCGSPRDVGHVFTEVSRLQKHSETDPRKRTLQSPILAPLKPAKFVDSPATQLAFKTRQSPKPMNTLAKLGCSVRHRRKGSLT